MEMSKFTFLIFALVAATTAAMPAEEDAVVPETALFESSGFAAARAEVQSLFTAGRSDKDCRKLSKDSIADVKKNVKTLQDELDKLPDGSKCQAKADKDAGVAAAKQTLDKAKKTLQDATKAHEDSKKKKLTFTIPLDKLKGKWWETTSVYKTAVDARKKARDAKEQAQGSKKTAQDEYDKALKIAAGLKKKCLCKDKRVYEKALKVAKKTDKDNKDAWDKAHKTLCVLDDTPEKDCKIPSTPVVKNKLHQEAQSIDLKKCPPSPPPPGSGLALFDKFGGDVTGGKGFCKNGLSKGWKSDCVDTTQLMKNGGSGFCAKRTGIWHHAMIGLDQTDSSNSYKDIDFAMFANSNDAFQPFEKGRQPVGSYNMPNHGVGAWGVNRYACLWVTKAGTVEYFAQSAGAGSRWITKAGGKLQYSAQNAGAGKMAHMYTSSTKANFPLKIDAAMYSANSEFSDVFWISDRPVPGSFKLPTRA